MCQQIIAISLRKSNPDEIPWTTLKYLIGEIIYGGKVIDSYDRRILLTYVDEYFGDFIYNSYQPFSFYNFKDCYKAVKYIEVERKIFENNKHNLLGKYYSGNVYIYIICICGTPHIYGVSREDLPICDIS